MIYDRLMNSDQYAALSARFAKAFEYIKERDLASLPVGRYDIDGDDVYLMIQQVELRAWEEGVWEAHRRYADIQMVLDGEETLGVRKADGLSVEKPYNEGQDVEFLDASKPGLAIPLSPGDFCVLFPQDAHRPCILSAKPEAGNASKRAVVKVKL